MPDTARRVRMELRRRRDAGKCYEIVNAAAKAMMDDNCGLFLRYEIFFADGDSFKFDSQEIPRQLRDELMN